MKTLASLTTLPVELLLKILPHIGDIRSIVLLRRVNRHLAHVVDLHPLMRIVRELASLQECDEEQTVRAIHSVLRGLELDIENKRRFREERNSRGGPTKPARQVLREQIRTLSPSDTGDTPAYIPNTRVLRLKLPDPNGSPDLTTVHFVCWEAYNYSRRYNESAGRARIHMDIPSAEFAAALRLPAGTQQVTLFENEDQFHEDGESTIAKGVFTGLAAYMNRIEFLGPADWSGGLILSVLLDDMQCEHEFRVPPFGNVSETEIEKRCRSWTVGDPTGCHPDRNMTEHDFIANLDTPAIEALRSLFFVQKPRVAGLSALIEAASGWCNKSLTTPESILRKACDLHEFTRKDIYKLLEVLQHCRWIEGDFSEFTALGLDFEDYADEDDYVLGKCELKLGSRAFCFSLRFSCDHSWERKADYELYFTGESPGLAPVSLLSVKGICKVSEWLGVKGIVAPASLYVALFFACVGPEKRYEAAWEKHIEILEGEVQKKGGEICGEETNDEEVDEGEDNEDRDDMDIVIDEEEVEELEKESAMPLDSLVPVDYLMYSQCPIGDNDGAEALMEVDGSSDDEGNEEHTSDNKMYEEENVKDDDDEGNEEHTSDNEMYEEEHNKDDDEGNADDEYQVLRLVAPWL